MFTREPVGTSKGKYLRNNVKMDFLKLAICLKGEGHFELSERSLS